MTHHDHEHHEQKHHGQHGGHPMHKRKSLHKDWRAWLVVILMLTAMAGYVLTMDESIRPGDAKPGETMPAAPGPPAPVVAP